MPEDATRDFGAYLKDARERAGIELRTIANNTKISMQSLEALERNDVSRLPGGIFLRAFVRAYAKEIGLEPEATVGRFVARFPDAAAAEEHTVHEPVQERRVLGDDIGTSQVWRIVGWGLPFVLVIVFFAFGGRLSWFRNLVRPSTARTEQIAEQPPPSSDTPVMTTPATPPSTAATDPAAGTAGPGTTTTGGAAEGTSPTTPGGANTPAAAPAAPAAAATETITSPSTEGQFRMTLAPTGRCWVTVRSNGAVVYSGTLQPGERKNLLLGGAVSLTVGDAASMAVELDGKRARPLGSAGEVKTIRLTADTLKDFLETR
jgi:cytoskeleton protein RodZ